MFIIRPQKCLYHLNHNLVLFCRCSSCCLPVCQVCIRIHKNQHIMYNTQPDFQKYKFLISSIDNVIKSVHNQFLEQQRKTSFLQKNIADIPRKLSVDQTVFKENFIQFRQKIIVKFEQLLIELEKSFIRQIHHQQINFLSNLQLLQRQSELMKNQVKQKLQSLQHHRSQTRMETIIQYYSSDQKQQFDSHFERILGQIQKCQQVQMQIPQLQILKEVNYFFESKLKQLEQKQKSKTQIQIRQNIEIS